MADAGFSHQLLEEELAACMAALLQDSVTPQVVVGDMELTCSRRAHAYRQDASQCALSNTIRSSHLDNLAVEMEGYAASWHLLMCLYGAEDAPAGDGGPAMLGMGTFHTHRQKLTTCVMEDWQLSRCARVVSWLESLADEEVQQQAAPRFAARDGVWLETCRHAGTGGVVREVDPDGPGREGRNLHPHDAREDERLLLRVWKLVRAGRVAEARQLCCEQGQAWRAASLCGGGEDGPLAVGLAAARAGEQPIEVQQARQAEEVSSEVDCGSGTSRQVWKWAAYETALALMRPPQSSAPGSKYEAAVYGALSGYVVAVLPVCRTWQDACWAHCRAWLDVCTDAACGADPGPPVSEQVPQSAVLAALHRFGVGVGDGAAAAKATLDTCAAVSRGAHGGLPALLLRGGASGVPLPCSWPDVFQALRGSPEGKVREAAVHNVTQVQQLVIQEAMADLTALLYRWLVQPRDTEEAARLRGANEASASSASGEATPEARAVAFAAHMVLALEALGVLRRHALTPATPLMLGTKQSWVQTARVPVEADKVCFTYAVTLLERRLWHLVPQYLAHVHEEGRSALGCELLGKLGDALDRAVAAGDDGAVQQADQECWEAHALLSHWFALCFARQEAASAAAELDEYGQAAAAPPSNGLHTTIRPDEMRVLLLEFVERCRGLPDLPPLHRAAALRWLLYCFRDGFAFRRPDQSPPGLFLSQPSPFAYVDALSCACALSVELALGDDVTVAAGHAMFEHIIPQGFEDMAMTTAQRLRHGAEGSGMQALDDDMAEAAAVDAGADEQAVQLEALASELTAWRLFFHARQSLAHWRGDLLVALAQQELQAPGRDTTTLAQEGRQLLVALQQQLLAPGAWLVSGAGALSTAALQLTRDSGAARVTVELLLTGRPASDDPAWSGPACAFPPLRGPVLFGTDERLRAALQSATAGGGAAAFPGVICSVGSPGGTEGFLTLTLMCNAEAQAWSSLVALASSVVLGSLEGLPDLLLVNLRADRPTSLAIARGCCLARLVVDSFSLRHALASLGVDSAADGADLVLLLSGVAGGGGAAGGTDADGDAAEDEPLLDMLPQVMLQEVLRLEAETLLLGLRQGQAAAVHAGV